MLLSFLGTILSLPKLQNLTGIEWWKCENTCNTGRCKLDMTNEGRGKRILLPCRRERKSFYPHHLPHCLLLCYATRGSWSWEWCQFCGKSGRQVKEGMGRQGAPSTAGKSTSIWRTGKHPSLSNIHSSLLLIYLPVLLSGNPTKSSGPETKLRNHLLPFSAVFQATKKL